MSLLDKLNDDGEIDITGVEEGAQPANELPDELEVPENNIEEGTAEEPTEQPQVEVGESTETGAGPVAEPESSLTPQTEKPVEEETTVPQEVPQGPITLDDQKVLDYLSEKLGKEVTNLEDLAKEPEPQTDPLEEDPQLKEIYEWRKRTGRPISDWISFQKDYDGMSNIDVAREILQYRYSELTPEEIQLELSNFVPREDDLEEDIARKNLNLKKFATDGRKELNSLKSQFDTELPSAGTASLTEEQKQKIELFDKFKEESAKQEANQKQQADEYNRLIASNITSVESIPLKLSEDIDIDFKIPTESKSTLQEFMQMKHWYKEDGSFDHQEIVKDSFFIQNRDTILKLAFEQGVAKGIEEGDKESRNLNLDGSRPTMDSKIEGQDDIVIEGHGDFFGKGGLTTRF